MGEAGQVCEGVGWAESDNKFFCMQAQLFDEVSACRVFQDHIDYLATICEFSRQRILVHRLNQFRI